MIKLEKIITEKFEKDQQSLKESITALEKKLKRKQNENQNLLDNIEKLTKVELDRVSEIYDLKEVLAERDKECVKLSDELAVKTKEQIDNIKVKDLESELEELRKALKITTEELWLHKEKLKIETENKRKKESKDELENNILLKEKGDGRASCDINIARINVDSAAVPWRPRSTAAPQKAKSPALEMFISNLSKTSKSSFQFKSALTHDFSFQGQSCHRPGRTVVSLPQAGSQV